MNVQESNHKNINGGNKDGCATGAAEFRVSGFGLSVLHPPADGHHDHRVLDEDEPNEADPTQERNEDQDAERKQAAKHDLERTGIADRPADVGGLSSGSLGSGRINRGMAKRALTHRGVDGLAAIGTWENADCGSKAQGHGGSDDLGIG